MKGLFVRPRHFAGGLVAITLVAVACGPPPLVDGLTEIIEIETLDLPGQLWDPFMPGPEEGKPATIEGRLDIPPTDQPVPGIVMIHGCGGPGGAERGWIDDLNDAGYATLLVDSFGNRAVSTVCFGGGQINIASLLVDAYRAASTLAENEYIDGSRMAIMGWSYGGRTALWTAMTRFQSLYEGDGVFQAHIAFYPSTCFITLEREDQVGTAPIRIFHGELDDWTPIEPCRDYVRRVSAAGADIELLAYEDAHHSFDDETTSQGIWGPMPAVSPRNCDFREVDEAIIDTDTGRVAGVGSSCVEEGVHFGWNQEAHTAAKADLLTFLSDVLGRQD